MRLLSDGIGGALGNGGVSLDNKVVASEKDVTHASRCVASGQISGLAGIVFTVRGRLSDSLRVFVL